LAGSGEASEEEACGDSPDALGRTMGMRSSLHSCSNSSQDDALSPRRMKGRGSIRATTLGASSVEVTQLCVIIEGAHGLRDADRGFAGNLSDPFCLCEVPGRPHATFRTRVVKNNLNPRWDYASVLSNITLEDKLVFTVYDADYSGAGEVLGTATLGLNSIPINGLQAELTLVDEHPNKPKEPPKLRVRVIAPQAIAHHRVDKSIELLPVWTQSCAHILNAVEATKSRNHKDTYRRVSTGLPNLQRKLSRLGTMVTMDGCCSRQCQIPLFHPESTGRIAWDLAGLVLLLLDCMWIPMQAFAIPDAAPIRAFTWLALIFWSMDIFVNCNSMYYGQEGTLIRRRKKVFWQYLTTWLPIDVLVVGVEWVLIIVLHFGEDSNRAGEGAGAARMSRLSRMTRIFRIFRLMRLPKLRRLMYTAQGLIESEVFTIAFVVCKNMFLVLLVNHAIACIWFAAGENGGWVDMYNFGDSDWDVHYLVSLQWALAQFTPGASNIQPTCVLEQFVGVTVLVLGMVLATCFISSITSAMASIWSAGHYHRAQAVLLRKFLHQQRLPRELAVRITRYVQFVIEFRHRRVHPSKVHYLDLLSGPLQQELKLNLHKPFLVGFPCVAQVACANPPSLQELCVNGVCVASYAKNDIVFCSGTEADTMCFLTLGSVAYRLGCGREEMRRLLEVGSWFREGALWMKWTHRGDMKAITSVDMLCLSAKKFGDVVTANGRVYMVARAHAFGFWESWQKAMSDEANDDLERFVITDLAVGNFRKVWRVGPADSFNEDETGRHEVTKAEEMQALLMDWAT